MNRLLRILLLGTVLAAVGCNSNGAKTATEEPVVPVIATEVKRGDIVSFIYTTGTIFPKQESMISPKTSGRIERLFVDELENWRLRKDIRFLDTVDRADADWKGHVGVITTLFQKLDINPHKTFCMVVGPPVMYRFVILEAKALGLSDGQIFLSLERRMKCGIGKCGHCQMNHIYVCQDGPVFTYEEIFDVEEAL